MATRSTGAPMLNSDWPVIRHIIDTLSAGAILGAILGALPAAAAFGAIVWYMIQIYESRTFQHWVANIRMKSRARRLARLKARQKVLAAEVEALIVRKQARAEARELVDQARAEAAHVLSEDEVKLQNDLTKI